VKWQYAVIAIAANFTFFPLLKAGAFHADVLDMLLPRDVSCEEMRAARMSVYQANVFRLFVARNSFSRFQLICLLVPILPWVRSNQVRHQKLLLLNKGRACLFLAMLPERTPVAVLSILSLVVIISGKAWQRRAG
jgi:hypothetical protein